MDLEFDFLSYMVALRGLSHARGGQFTNVFHLDGADRVISPPYIQQFVKIILPELDDA